MDENVRTTVNIIRRIEKELNEQFYERRAVIHGLWLSLIARQHCLLLGPTGSGKRSLVKAVGRRILTSTTTDGLRLFDYYLMTSTQEDEIFGPFYPVRSQRVTSGAAPEAELLFLENIGAHFSSHLRSLLVRLLEQRQFWDGVSWVPAPLISCIGVMYEAPNEKETQALREQFALVYPVHYLSDANMRVVMEHHALQRNLSPASSPLASTTVSYEDVSTLQTFAGTVAFSPGTETVFRDFWALLQQHDIVVSSQVQRRCFSLLQAQATLQDRTTILQEDFAILAHSVWNTLAERQVVTRLTSSMT